ncbi:16_t:CDS:1, partial [Entrophospora sp. SA101]
LDSVPLITIRRFAQKAWRYMDLYRHGIGGKLAEYAVRKYRSHRKIPDEVLKELEKIRI